MMPYYVRSFSPRFIGVLLVLSITTADSLHAQRSATGFAFEAYAEPCLGVLGYAPYRGWMAGAGVGYKITAEYSLWLGALAGPGRRPRELVGEEGARDDFGMLRLSARRIFLLDSTVLLTPVVSYRVSTFLLPDGTTIGGRGIEVGAGVTLHLDEHFEAGGEAAYTYDSFHYRSGSVSDIPSFSGSDLALRFLLRFHPAIP